MAYIFDLDQTIVDSSIAEKYRKQRQWEEVYRLIPYFTLYAGIKEIFSILREKGEKICVVTSSPQRYCQKVLDYFGLQVDSMVCFHDTRLHKPESEPIEKAIELLGVSPENVISVGDTENDVIASRAAGVVSCLALWGNIKTSLSVSADYIFKSVDDLRMFINT